MRVSEMRECSLKHHNIIFNSDHYYLYIRENPDFISSAYSVVLHTKYIFLLKKITVRLRLLIWAFKEIYFVMGPEVGHQCQNGSEHELRV